MAKLKREGISKKRRFEIFKRDSFCCQYCGAKPPKIPLEIDHIMPVSKGGNNEDYNLITSCFDCNRGKSNRELSIIPLLQEEKFEKMKLAQAQYKEIKKIIEAEKTIINDQINSIEDVYSKIFTGYVFSDKFRLSVKKFISILGIQEVAYSMELACGRIYDREKALAYFCGICWKWINHPEESKND